MAVSPSSVPTVIAGRYRLDGELGRGGMAEVRAGTDLRLRRPVAVKFLLPEMAAREDIRRRFEAEARSAASLTDPHAVAVYDTGEHDGTPYIVMERLPGETLADRIAAGPVDPRWLREVACEVLGALGAAHAGGLVHRDVKPGNILLTADGHAKIADFGIAKSLEGHGLDGTGPDLDLTSAGQLLGTPAYLAPERLHGAPATARSDLYSLGVVLYEALAGARPFRGDTPLATAQAVVAGDVRPLALARPDLDPALVATVERAMATDPDRRFGSAAAMASALSSPPTSAATGAGAVALAGDPTIVDGFGGPGTAVLDLHDVAGTSRGLPSTGGLPPSPAPVRRPRGRVPLALLAGLLFLALLAAGLHARSTPSPTAAGAASAPTTAAARATTTTPPSPAVALANDLRDAAGRLGPADGARAGDLAAMLRQVADQVQAGGGGGAATGAIVSIGAWHLTGQLSDAAAAAAIDLLSRVPGVTVVTIPSLTLVPNAPANGGKGKGKGNAND